MATLVFFFASAWTLFISTDFISYWTSGFKMVLHYFFKFVILFPWFFMKTNQINKFLTFHNYSQRKPGIYTRFIFGRNRMWN